MDIQDSICIIQRWLLGWVCVCVSGSVGGPAESQLLQRRQTLVMPCCRALCLCGPVGSATLAERWCGGRDAWT